MSNITVVRYSDSDLEEFRTVILDRLKKAQEELDDLRSQILDITESLEGDFGNDYMDDSSVASDLEMLNNMAIRKRKYIQDLENALIRIKNKTYGICSITGELIDKKRLLAVPTTTKSLHGKVMEQSPTRLNKEEEEDDSEKTSRPATPAAPASKIITRVIRKSSTPSEKTSLVDEEEEEDFTAGDEFMPDLKRIDAADVADELEDDMSDMDDDFDDFDDDLGDDDGMEEDEDSED